MTAMAEHSTAIISGASRWLGKFLAGHLLGRGYHVAMLARNRAELEAAAAEVQALAAEGARALPVVCDISDETQVKAAVAACEQTLGPVSLLVNNASGASGLGKPFLELTANELNLALSTNVYGTFFLSQAVLPGMLSRRSGTVINISSNSGHRGTAGAAPAAVGKFALHGLTESMAREFRKQGVHIVTFAIDSGIDNEKSAARMTEENRPRTVDMTEIARTLDYLIAQGPRGWTHEMSIIPAEAEW